ncbi:MAG TPA: type I secretion C-terminal target domain-containing protein, partial [Alphaproteobacteria bacterium]
ADSENAVVSPDGSKVAFLSVADNLVAGDTNNHIDLFVKDLVTGGITRISQTATGVQGNGDSYGPAWSPDGHQIAFITMASNFGAVDTNGTQDIYIKDLETGALALVSHTAANQAGASYSVSPSFSADGTKITYTSMADNLVAGDYNGTSDIFTAEVSGNPHIITGTQYDNTLNGTADNDVIDGRGGKDAIYAGGGADVAWAGTGKSVLYGGEGADALFGRDGNDKLYGDNGNDILRGGNGADKIYGGENDDKLYGDADNDTLYGNSGNDLISGGDGADRIYGANGNDRIDGGADADALHGGAGNDIMHGGTGSDVLYGDGSSDYLYGDGGDDALYGGTGTNHLIGGEGADSFVVTADSFDAHADKFDDFSVAQGDVLLLEDILSGFNPVNDAIADFVAAAQSGNDAVIAVDRDGAGVAHSFEAVAILANVAGVDVQDWYDGGRIAVG